MQHGGTGRDYTIPRHRGADRRSTRQVIKTARAPVGVDLLARVKCTPGGGPFGQGLGVVTALFRVRATAGGRVALARIYVVY